MGTCAYSAPELIAAMRTESECCTPKSDVFSMGLVFWEIATCHRPYRSWEEIKQGTFEEFERDKKAVPTCPRSSFFGPVIERCIQPEEKRYSAHETLRALTKIST